MAHDGGRGVTDYKRARYQRSDIVRLMMGATNGGIREDVAMRDVARMTSTPLPVVRAVWAAVQPEYDPGDEGNDA